MSCSVSVCLPLFLFNWPNIYTSILSKHGQSDHPYLILGAWGKAFHFVILHIILDMMHSYLAFITMTILSTLFLRIFIIYGCLSFQVLFNDSRSNVDIYSITFYESSTQRDWFVYTHGPCIPEMKPQVILISSLSNVEFILLTFYRGILCLCSGISTWSLFFFFSLSLALVSGYHDLRKWNSKYHFIFFRDIKEYWHYLYFGIWIHRKVYLVLCSIMAQLYCSLVETLRKWPLTTEYLVSHIHCCSSHHS